MALQISELICENQGENYRLHEKHLNHQYVKVLKTIGFNKVYVKAEGQYLYDTEGNKYLDLLSGYGVYNIGRNHPDVIRALKDVLDAQLSNLVQFDCPLLCGLLAEKLLSLFPEEINKVFFCNSGAEAIEGAIKFGRAATGRSKTLFCDHGFHGLTCGALSLNGSGIFRENFGPLLEGCEDVPFNNLERLESALKTREYASFVVEPIQGKGVYMPSDDFFPEAARLCKKYGTLFVVDEIQTGFGRTGEMFAFQNWGVEPDIVTMAKALSGGFVPVGAIVTRKWIYDKVFPSMERAVVHSSTFSKNNLAMAAGLATLSIIEEEGLVQKARENGEKLLSGLQKALGKYEFVKDVRGKGMMVGVEFGPPQSFKLKAAWQVLDKADKGLFCQMITIPLLKNHRILCQVAGHASYVIKLIPPLALNDLDIEHIVKSFDNVVSEAHKVPGSIWSLGTTLAKHAING